MTTIDMNQLLRFLSIFSVTKTLVFILFLYILRTLIFAFHTSVSIAYAYVVREGSFQHRTSGIFYHQIPAPD
jgi:hypothetical protein